MSDETPPGLGPDVAERRVRLGDLDVRYWEQGDGHPVVLLHGGLATADMSWANAFAALAPTHRVLAPDTRGHGGTNNPTDRLGYDQLADDVVALCAALGAERPVVVGHSDGGQIALELGLRHPGAARGLVLSGTMSEPTPGYVAGLHAWGFTAPGEVDIEAVQASFDDFYETTRAAHDHARSPEAWTAFLRQTATLWLTLPAYTDEQLATITDPTLVVTGDRDELADLDQARRLFRHIRSSQLGVVPNAGHGAADEPIFWQIVQRFVTELAGDRRST
jgi:pimeloyl-ACP methyl ester carboxylesterase